MADKRERQRMVFECPEEIKRAIRGRAGIEGVSPGEVILAALREYLGEEIEKVAKKIEEGSAASGHPRKRKDA